MRTNPAVVAGALLLLALLVLPLFGVDEYWIYILTIGFYYAILAASWSLLVGYVGRISFAQAAFAGLGAYTFLRPQQVINYTREALESVEKSIVALSAAEDLPAHGDAVTARFRDA